MAESAAALCPGHAALLYGSTDEYLRRVLGFVTGGLDKGEPVFVAVPGPKVDMLRDRMDGRADWVTFADMTQMGANPVWIIPRVRDFVAAHPGRAVRYVGEPIWETRTPEALTEATRHEALINLAFADSNANILCPYDTTRLGPGVISAAERTHPVIIRDGRPQSSRAYSQTAMFPEEADRPLPAPPDGAAALCYRDELARLRAFVAEHCGRAGLSADRTDDMVIAVNELAANTLRHTDADGWLHIWPAAGEVICQIQDTGHIEDPLAGRVRPRPDARGGQGLWVANQLSDLTELRTGQAGTTIRLHMRLTP